MKFLFLLYTLFCSTLLAAEVSITTKADKTSLSINEQLAVEVSLSYPATTPPELFAFFYDLLKQPQESFKVVSFSLDKPIIDSESVSQSLHFLLEPGHTGRLIFAPGVINFSGNTYLVPPLKVECKSVALSTPPLAPLLPLYSERRIYLSPTNRLFIMSEKAQEMAKEKNIEAYQSYRSAWDGLAYAMVSIAFGGLFVWAIVYYELIERAKKPLKIAQTPLQLVIRELQDPNLAPSVRWQRLAHAFRVVLGAKTAQNVQTLSLIELAEYVESSSAFTASEKKELIPSIHILGDICYAARPATDEEWQKMRAGFFKVAAVAG